MDFVLYCECGRDVPVAPTSAGTAVSCACGRRIDVPSLGELRRQSGLPAYQANSALVIEHMLGNHELPTVPHCANCAGGADETLLVTAECEKSFTSGPGGAATLFAFLIIGIWAFLLRQRETKEHGRNVILHLPVKICSGCRRSLFRLPHLPDMSWLAVTLALSGLVILCVLWEWGWLLVGAGVLVWAADKFLKHRHRRVLYELLRREPIYARLLNEYPHAELVARMDGGS